MLLPLSCCRALIFDSEHRPLLLILASFKGAQKIKNGLTIMEKAISDYKEKLPEKICALNEALRNMDKS